MRCAAPSTFWASPDGGASLVEYSGLSLGVEGASCVSGQYVVMTQQEVDQVTVSPFRLTAMEGALISGAIIGTWATAFCIRALIEAIKGGNPET